MINKDGKETQSIFGTLFDYGRHAASTVWSFIEESIIGDAYKIYYHTEDVIQELDRQSWESGTNLGIGYLGGSWLRMVPVLGDRVPKIVYVSGTDRKSFESVAEYGEENSENISGADSAARAIFAVVEKLLGLKVLNNLQGEEARNARKLMKNHLHQSFEELHSYSKDSYRDFLSQLDPDESFAVSIYRLTVTVMCRCFFGVNAELKKNRIPELMQMAHLITNPNYSNSQIEEAAKCLRQMSAELLEEGSNAVHSEKFIAAHAGLTNEMPEAEKMTRLHGENIAGSFLAAVNLSDLIMKTMVEIGGNSELIKVLFAELEDPAFEKLQELRDAPLLERVYCEAQRMFPPSIIVRRTSKFTVIETTDEQKRKHQTSVAPHSVLIAPIRARLLSEHIWDKPQLFNPDRFLGEEGKERKKYLNTFSDGIRACPAKYGFTEILFKQLIREFVLNVKTLTLDKEVEEIPVHSINTSWKQTYHAEYTFRDKDEQNSKGKGPAEIEEALSENSYGM